MIILGVLCLAACVLAQPAVYVSRTTLKEYPYAYYYPMNPSMVDFDPEKAIEEGKKIIISTMPKGPGMLPLATLVLEPTEDKSKEDLEKKEDIEPHKEEELKEEEFIEDEEKEEEKKEDEHISLEEHKDEEEGLRLWDGLKGDHERVIVRLKPPQYVSDFIHAIPSWFPYDFPILGPIFGKPPVGTPEPAPITEPGTGSAPEPIPVEAARFRYAYAPMLGEPIVTIKKL